MSGIYYCFYKTKLIIDLLNYPGIILIQDSNLDPNIRSIMLYHWANKNKIGRKGFEPSLVKF